MRKWWKFVGATLLGLLAAVRGIVDAIGELQTVNDLPIAKWLIHPYFSLAAFTGATVLSAFFYFDYRVRKEQAGFVGNPRNRNRYRRQAITGASLLILLLVISPLIYGHYRRGVTAGVKQPGQRTPPAQENITQETVQVRTAPPVKNEKHKIVPIKVAQSMDQKESSATIQQSQSVAAPPSPSAAIAPRNLPTGQLDRLIETNKHLTEGDRDRLATALFKFSLLLDQANGLWGKVNHEFSLLDSDWNNGSMTQNFDSHRATLRELDSQAKDFRDSYRKTREDWSYYQEQTSYVLGDNENEGPNALINAIEAYAGLLDQWSKIENKEQKQLQPLISGSQTQPKEFFTTFVHWKQGCDQRLVEMKKSIQ
jgi:hypothetical protein